VIVVSDTSPINNLAAINQQDYAYGYSPIGERCHALKCGKKKRESQLDERSQGWESFFSFNL
jgi:hypothetical protein